MIGKIGFKGVISVDAMAMATMLVISLIGIYAGVETVSSLGSQSVETADSQELTKLSGVMRETCRNVRCVEDDSCSSSGPEKVKLDISKGDDIEKQTINENGETEKYLRISFPGDGGGTRKSELLPSCKYRFVQDSGGSLSSGIHNLKVESNSGEVKVSKVGGG